MRFANSFTTINLFLDILSLQFPGCKLSGGAATGETVKQLNETEVIIGPCRLSYCHLFNPRANDQKQGSPLEYSVVCLIPKMPHEYLPDPETETREIVRVMRIALDAKFKAKPPVWRPAMLDGDKEINRSTGKPQYPGYWYISCWNDRRPILIDVNGADIRKTHDDTDWTSGDWGKVQLNFYGFDSKGNKGVSASLRAVQFLHKDEPFGKAGRDISSVVRGFQD